MGEFYQTRRLADGKPEEMVRTVWSFTYCCPKCHVEIVYFTSLCNDGLNSPESCSECGEKFVRRLWPRKDDVPVQVVVRGENGRLQEQPVQEVDLKMIRRAAKDIRQEQVPNQRITELREMYRRSGLGKHGMVETKLFFFS